MRGGDLFVLVIVLAMASPAARSQCAGGSCAVPSIAQYRFQPAQARPVIRYYVQPAPEYTPAQEDRGLQTGILDQPMLGAKILRLEQVGESNHFRLTLFNPIPRTSQWTEDTQPAILRRRPNQEPDDPRVYDMFVRRTGQLEDGQSLGVVVYPDRRIPATLLVYGYRGEIERYEDLFVGPTCTPSRSRTFAHRRRSPEEADALGERLFREGKLTSMGTIPSSLHSSSEITLP